MNNLENNSKKDSKMYGNAAHTIYAQNNASVESPSKLVEMLYEGVLRFNAQAKKALRDKNIEKRTYWTNRSIAVVTELINILDMSQGQLSEYLQGLYSYQIQLLSTVALKDGEAKLDEVSNVFKVLLELWRETTNVAN